MPAVARSTAVELGSMDGRRGPSTPGRCMVHHGANLRSIMHRPPYIVRHPGQPSSELAKKCRDLVTEGKNGIDL